MECVYLEKVKFQIDILELSIDVIDMYCRARACLL